MILPKKGQNTENTTFLHVKMMVVQGCARAKIFRIVFYGQNDPKTVKKKACTLVLESSKINLNTLGLVNGLLYYFSMNLMLRAKKACKEAFGI